MRILMTTDTLGGVWTYSVELIRALSGTGVETVLASLGARLSTSQRSDIGKIPGVEIHESNYKLEWMDDPWDEVDASGQWLLELGESSGAELAHINGYSHAALPWKIPVLSVGHSCVFSWFHWVEGQHPPPVWETYRSRVAAGLKAADLVVAPTKAMLNELTSYYGPLKNTMVIANARNADDFPPLSKEPFVFGAGRLWDQAKNLQMLAQIAPALPWPVVLAGDPVHPSGNRIDFGPVRVLGPLASWEMAQWLGRASIFAAPARYEPFGLTALEAGLAGCCLVLGDIPSLREVWGDAALFIAPDDSAGLADALKTLIADADLRSRRMIAARERALSFTPHRQVEKYTTVYDSLIRSKRRKRAVRA